jgi:hypothetical protein
MEERQPNKLEKAADYLLNLFYFGPLAIPILIVLSPFILIWAVLYYIYVLRPTIK